MNKKILQNPNIDLVKEAKNLNHFKSGQVPYDLKKLALENFTALELLTMAAAKCNDEDQPLFENINILKQSSNGIAMLVEHFLHIPVSKNCNELLLEDLNPINDKITYASESVSIQYSVFKKAFTQIEEIMKNVSNIDKNLDLAVDDIDNVILKIDNEECINECDCEYAHLNNEIKDYN